MVAQNGRGELTVRDSHEYGGTHDLFDKNFINEMIIDYLRKFVQRLVSHRELEWPLYQNNKRGILFILFLRSRGFILSMLSELQE